MSSIFQPTPIFAPSVPPAQEQSKLLWQTLAKWLPKRSSSHEWWWKTMGSHVGFLLSSADYGPNEQVEALLFLYHWVADHLGPQPISATPMWKSFMTDDYSPVEYSWKWSKGDKAPEIRYSIEAIGAQAGTSDDPLNQAASRNLLYMLCKYDQSIDLTWFEHFSQALLGPSTPAGSPTAPIGVTTVFLAFEMVHGRIGVKAYFIPVDGPGQSAAQQILQAIRTAGCQNSNALDELEAFLAEDPDGSDLTPFMLGIDCVAPEVSRLKIYARSTRTSLTFARRIMVLGGRRPVSRAARDSFCSLWRKTLGIYNAAVGDADQLPPVHHETAGLLFYFDVASKGEDRFPDVKAYIPVRHYAESDLQVARGLLGYLENHGQGWYAQAYMQSLRVLQRSEKQLERSTGVHTYITAAYQGDSLSVTSYLSPQIYASLKRS